MSVFFTDQRVFQDQSWLRPDYLLIICKSYIHWNYAWIRQPSKFFKRFMIWTVFIEHSAVVHSQSSGFLWRPKKIDNIFYQKLWLLFSKIQINLEISSNFCGLFRKSDLFSPLSKNRKANIKSKKPWKLVNTVSTILTNLFFLLFIKKHKFAIGFLLSEKYRVSHWLILNFDFNFRIFWLSYQKSIELQ